MAIVPANEQGNNPPAWPAEGAGQGLYRLRRQGHHIADRPLAVKMAIAVDLALAHLQRGGPDLLTARPAAGVKVRQRGRDAVGLLQRFAQHDGILNRHARPLTEMRSGSVNRVAHQHDASLIPGIVDEQLFQRLIDDLVVVNDMRVQAARQPRAGRQTAAHLRRQLIAGVAGVIRFVGGDKQIHQIVRQRHQPAVAALAHKAHQMVHLRRSRKVVAPYALTGKAGAIALAVQHAAHPGVEPNPALFITY